MPIPQQVQPPPAGVPTTSSSRDAQSYSTLSGYLAPVAKTYSVPDSHPCYAEIHALVSAKVATFATLVLEQSRQQYDQACAFLKSLAWRNADVREFQAPPPATVDDSITHAAEGCPESLIYHDCRRVLEQIRTGIPLLSELRFDLVPFAPAHDPRRQPRGQLIGGPPRPHSAIDPLYMHAIGAKFEEYKSRIEQKHGRNPRGWPPLFQFFRLLRNGCFHRNRFNIVSTTPQIDPSNPPRWHTLVMGDDGSMNGSEVVGGFLKRPHVVPFLADIGDELLAL